MEIIRDLNNINTFNDSVLSIGSYDGIHNGHKKILSELVNYSNSFNVPSVLITFDPHPRQVIGEKIENFSLIMTLDQKLEIIQSIGIDFVHIINFTKSFSKIGAQEFLNTIIVKNYNPSYIVIGYNHHFGNQRIGSPQYLKEYCNKRSIGLNIVEPVSFQNKEVSSSKIREYILEGEIQKANSLLGSLYTIKAKVVKGSGRGKKLKFPTANITPIDKNQILPSIGVYFVRARIIGLNAYGMCNFGFRPTYNENKLVMEIHFFHDKLSNLNGREIKVEFLERIRDEKKFHSSEKLVKQLIQDKQTCLSLMAKYE